ncbi:MAG: hypothetical protein ACKVT2_07555 [Saprospiraceae bacterium]
MQFDSIENLLEFLEGYQGNDLYYFDLGALTEFLAEEIYHLSGIEASGYYHIVDSYSIRHIWSRHSNPEIELSRGQLVIEKSDIGLIPMIVKDYDQLIYEFSRQKHTMIFQKELPKGRYVYSAEIRVGKHRRICCQSLRILNIKKAD